MTHIEQAIRDADNAGYKPSQYQGRLEYVGNKAAYYFRPDDERFPSEGTWLSEVFLDPAFWQALGKARGWSEIQLSDSVHREHAVDGDDERYYRSLYKREWQATRGWNRGWHLEGWHYQMLRFADHLAEGKDAESFFKDLE